MEKSKLIVTKVKEVFAELKGWDILSGDSDYMSVTEWSNGDGFDVELNSHKTTERFGMTWGQFKLFKKLVKKIAY